MKIIIFKIILCLLSFATVFGISISIVSAVSISGSIDKRIIQKVIRLHESEVRSCYETALLKDHKLTGTILTKFIILPNGHVEKAWIEESTLNNSEVEKCVIDHIETWIFYRYKGENKFLIEYPYEFVSNYKPPTFLEHVRLILNEEDMKVDYFNILPLQSE